MPVRKNATGDKYVVRSGEREVELTEEELFSRAEKGFGAESKFEQAAATLKEAETKIEQAKQEAADRYAALFTKAHEGDATAFEEVLTIMKLPADEKYRQLAAFKELQAQKENPEEEEEVETAPSKKAVKVEFPEEVQGAGKLVKVLQSKGFSEEEIVELLQEQRETSRKGRRDVAFSELRAELDKDPQVARILKKGGAKAERLEKLAQEKLRSRIRDEQRYDASTRAAVVKDLKADIQELGIGSELTSLPGLGEGPGISQFASQAAEPPKAVSPLSGDYEKNVMERLAYAAVND